MNDEISQPEGSEQNDTDHNDTRRSMLKGAAAMAAATVAATLPNKASAANGWPDAAHLQGPNGCLTIEDVRGTLRVRVVLEGISEKAAQEITFVARTPRALTNANLVDMSFDAWQTNTLLCW